MTLCFSRVYYIIEQTTTIIGVIFNSHHTIASQTKVKKTLLPLGNDLITLTV